MSLLTEYIEKSGSTPEGIKAFAADVAACYGPIASVSGKKIAKCRWFFEFQAKDQRGNEALVFAMENPNLSPGQMIHGQFLESRVNFETYHLLTPKEASLLAWGGQLKKVFLPAATLGTLGFGFLFIFVGGIALIVLAGAFLKSTPNNGHGHPWAMTLGILACGLLTVASRKLQLFLQKLTVPPGTTEFSDQRIKLASVVIE